MLQIKLLRHCRIAKEIVSPGARLILLQNIYYFFRLLKAVGADFLFFAELFWKPTQFGTLVV